MPRILTFTTVLVFILALSVSVCCSQVSPDIIDPYPSHGGDDMTDKVVKTDEEWRQLLTPEQYEVTRRKGTEAPFTGEFYDFHGQGTYNKVPIYVCAAVTSCSVQRRSLIPERDGQASGLPSPIRASQL